MKQKEQQIQLEQNLRNEFIYEYSTNRIEIKEIEVIWGRILGYLGILLLFPLWLLFWVTDNLFFWIHCKKFDTPYKILSFTSFDSGTPFHQIGRIENRIKLDISSNEHPPPHFHVFIDDKKFSFRIKDCAQISGGKIKSRDKRKIIKWYSNNRNFIIKEWNEKRPTNCKVGEYKE